MLRRIAIALILFPALALAQAQRDPTTGASPASAAAASEAKAATVSPAAPSSGAAALQLMRDKGLITQAEYEAAMAQAAAATVTTVTTSEVVVIKEEPKKKEPPLKAAVSFSGDWGEASFGLLLQSWFYGSTDDRFYANSTTPNFTTQFAGTAPGSGITTFRIRRAEFSFGGVIAKLVTFRLMIDPAIVQGGPISISSGRYNPANNSVSGVINVRDILQDAWVGVRIPYHEIRMGQFKIPLTMEGYGSSSKLDFAERAMVTRFLGDVRDLGIGVFSRDVPFVEYQLAVVNGTGKNLTATSTHKSGVGRLVVKPVKGVSFGGSGAFGSVWDNTNRTYLLQNRAGAELNVQLFGIIARGEYVAGRTGNFSSTSGEYNTAPAGWYATLGYQFDALKLPELQLLASYEDWNSDTNTSIAQCATGQPAAGSNRCVKNAGWRFGVNYDVLPKVIPGSKLQLNYYRGVDWVRGVWGNEFFLVAQFVI